MHLVDRPRRGGGVARGPRAHPLGVAPLVGEVPDDRAGLWRRLRMHGVRIGLLDGIAVVARIDPVLVDRAVADARDEADPDAGRAVRREGVAGRVPEIE